MPQIMKIFVPGIPAPQGSKRHVGGGKYIEASKRLPEWREKVTQIARYKSTVRTPLDEPVYIRVEFRFPTPKTKPKRAGAPHTVAPDLDKLQRAIGDALTNAGIIKDDSRIWDWWAAKTYCGLGQEPGATIYIGTKGSVDGSE